MASTTPSRWMTALWLSSTTGTTTYQQSVHRFLEVCSYHVTPIHPVWVYVGRRSQSTSRTMQLRINASDTPPVGRWSQNFSRLYARRILELATASAATQRLLTDLEDVIDKPSDWENWKRRDWTRELYDSMGGTTFERVFRASMRLATLALLATPVAVLYPISLVSDTVRQYSWDYALWGIEQAGPTFVKLIQWATTRQDLFSPEFCVHFGKLRDDTIGHSWAATQTILHQDLGSLAEYLQLEHDPIGSGCIAQVYRGRLTQGTGQYPANTEIAVKVQHPGIWSKVCVDFYILAKVAKFLEDLPHFNLQYLSLVDLVRQFRDIMLPQLDLTLEAKHLQRFNRDFSSDDRVSFPFPIHDLTTTRVLTETFVNGKPIMAYLHADKSLRQDLAELGLQATLKMIFLYDFIHGDMHPGNMLVSEEASGRPHLHLLDCGLVVEMGPDQHVNVVKILGAFIRKDGKTAGQLMVDATSNCQASTLDIQLFVNGIDQIVKQDKDHNFVEKVGDYIADVCYLACKHKVKLEASFINAALAVEIMEGIASALYPDIRVIPTALPLVIKAEMMHRLPKFW